MINIIKLRNLKKTKSIFTAATVAAVIFVSSSFVNPKQEAHAVVGIATQSVAAMVVGGVIAAGGGVIDYLAFGPGGYDGSFVAIGIVLGLPVTITGLIILDEEQSTISFSEITDDIASKVGLSNDEANAFNEEIDLINVFSQGIAEDLSSSKTVSVKDQLDRSAILWIDALNQLSPDTQSAFKKMIAVHN